LAKSKAPPPPQSSKARSNKGFGENISQLSVYISVSHLDISLSNPVREDRTEASIRVPKMFKSHI
jgi:hypothetical protein